MAFIGSNNALAWAQFRLRGGWYRSVTFAIGACVLLAVLVAGHARLTPVDASRVLYGWSSGLMVLQAATLVLYASGRIGAGVRNDIQTKLIESHRLMPMPPMHAAAGYIVGNILQPLVFAAGIFLIGMFTTARAGMDVQRWIFANAVLLGFCIFVWVFMVYASFGARLGPLLIFLPIIIPYASEGGGLALLPAITLLLSPIAGTSIFDLRGEANWLSPVYALSFAAQIYVGIILFLAAARRYRAADAVGLNTILGLCLVLGWSAISCVALREWDDLRPRGWSAITVETPAQLIASMICGMILALAPISASAREHMLWRRHKRLRDPAPMARPIPMLAALTVATAAIVVIGFAPPNVPFPPSRTVAVTVIAVAAAMTSMYFLYEMIYSGIGTAGIVAFVWILIAWIGPIAMDMVLYGLSDLEREILGPIAASSPLGALIIVWDERPVKITAGIVGLLLISTVPALVFLALTMRRRRLFRVGGLVLAD